MDRSNSSPAIHTRKMWTTPSCACSMLHLVSFACHWRTTLPENSTSVQQPSGLSVWWCYSKIRTLLSRGSYCWILCCFALLSPRQCAGQDSTGYSIPVFHCSGSLGSFWPGWASVVFAVWNGLVCSVLRSWAFTQRKICGISLVIWKCPRLVADKPKDNWILQLTLF